MRFSVASRTRNERSQLVQLAGEDVPDAVGETMSGMAIDPDHPLASSPAGLVREFHEYVGASVRSTPSVTVEGARAPM